MSGLADEKPKKVPDKYVDGQKIITIPVVGYEVKEKTYLLVMELFFEFYGHLFYYDCIYCFREA